MTTQKLIRILYAEDEPDIREIVKITLEELGGFVVNYCSNGEEVLNNANEFQPDLFLLDVLMPIKDGIVVLQELRKQHQFAKTPIIFMTAKVQKEELSRYFSLGVTDVIIKPFDPMKLPDMINLVWRKFHER